MGDILIWLIIGLVAGGVASLIVPGRTPGGAIGAVVVGIVGGLLGGWVLQLLDVNENLSWIGALIVAILGAVAILYALRATGAGTRSRV